MAYTMNLSFSGRWRWLRHHSIRSWQICCVSGASHCTWPVHQHQEAAVMWLLNSLICSDTPDHSTSGIPKHWSSAQMSCLWSEFYVHRQPRDNSLFLNRDTRDDGIIQHICTMCVIPMRTSFVILLLFNVKLHRIVCKTYAHQNIMSGDNYRCKDSDACRVWLFPRECQPAQTNEPSIVRMYTWLYSCVYHCVCVTLWMQGEFDV